MSEVCATPIGRGPQKGRIATGTVAGYRRHLYANEPACEDCLAGKSADQREWYSGHREQYIEANRRWWAANRDRSAGYKRNWRKQNPEKSRLQHQQFKQSNPGWMRAYAREHRARRRNALTIPFTEDQLSARLSMFPGCWMCGGPADEVDHVKPLAKGGAHTLSNLRPACRSCNARKHSQWPFEAVTKGAPSWGT